MKEITRVVNAQITMIAQVWDSDAEQAAYDTVNGNMTQGIADYIKAGIPAADDVVVKGIKVFVRDEV